MPSFAPSVVGSYESIFRIFLIFILNRIICFLTLEKGFLNRNVMSQFKYEFISQTSASNQDLVHSITCLVNQVYREAEQGLWVNGTDRTYFAEVQNLIQSGAIAVARDQTKILGCIKVYFSSPDYAEFGMLATHPEWRGQGIGSQLIKLVESTAIKKGIQQMHLVLLVPKNWRHSEKEFLKTWYSSKGYHFIESSSASETEPALAPYLATPSEFLVYRKPLNC
jgi:N-acetylglutamate synthase-like GNAT family acetyltransferase